MARNDIDVVDIAIATAAANAADARPTNASIVAAAVAASALPARGPSEPFAGLDVSGMPVDLVTAETNAFRRLSPRRNRWPELAALDARVAELEQRQGEATVRGQELRERLRTEPTRHAEALAQWELGNRKGATPRASVRVHRARDRRCRSRDPRTQRRGLQRPRREGLTS